MLAYLQWIGFNWTTWLVLAASGLAYYALWRNSRFVRLIDAIPGPRGLPVLGSILDLNVDQVGKLSIPVASLHRLYRLSARAFAEFLKIVHRDWVAEHGNIYAGWGGMRAIVTVSSPELMEVLRLRKLSAIQ